MTRTKTALLFRSRLIAEQRYTYVETGHNVVAARSSAPPFGA